MKVKRNTLLLLACLIWSAAGFNILRIGLLAYPAYGTVVNYLLSVLVFSVFQWMIFGKLVKKHTARIQSYGEERHFFLKFFDGKAFAIMAVMMSGGTIMKRYMNTALLYAILAMVGGVFYREFTKFNGFTAKTTLSVVHTHYFLLGMVFFLLLLVLEKRFSFTGPKTGRVLAVYHIGLNLTAVMLVVRGVVQVLGVTLSAGMNASISGMAGIGHVLLGVSLVLVLLQLKRSVTAKG